MYRGGVIWDGILDEKPGIETLPGKARNKRNHNGFEEYKRIEWHRREAESELTAAKLILDAYGAYLRGSKYS